MAHRRRPLAIALGLNTAVLAVEIAGGLGANSLSLIVDGIHNSSDEIAIGFLVLAYTLRRGLSGHFLRSANFFNSVGLLTVSARSSLGSSRASISSAPGLGLHSDRGGFDWSDR